MSNITPRRRTSPKMDARRFFVPSSANRVT